MRAAEHRNQILPVFMAAMAVLLWVAIPGASGRAGSTDRHAELDEWPAVAADLSEPEVEVPQFDESRLGFDEPEDHGAPVLPLPFDSSSLDGADFKARPPWTTAQLRRLAIARARTRDAAHADALLATDVSLAWLAEQQADDGTWPSETGLAAADHERILTTGLVVLAFLGAGNTHREGPFKQETRRSLRWLRERQHETGRFTEGVGSTLHAADAIGALVMVEAYRVTRSVLWKGPAERGLSWFGWASREGEAPEFPVMAWAMLASALAREDSRLANATFRAPGSWLFQLERGQRDDVARAAASCRAFAHLGRFPSEGSQDPDRVALTRALRSSDLPTKGVSVELFYLALLAIDEPGGEAWPGHRADYERRVLAQRAESPESQGRFEAFDASGAWAQRSVATTALMTLCLLIPYR